MALSALYWAFADAELLNSRAALRPNLKHHNKNKKMKLMAATTLVGF
jgi:hypothetical protein